MSDEGVSRTALATMGLLIIPTARTANAVDICTAFESISKVRTCLVTIGYVKSSFYAKYPIFVNIY